jgi:hypothetical protein
MGMGDSRHPDFERRVPPDDQSTEEVCGILSSLIFDHPLNSSSIKESLSPSR